MAEQLHAVVQDKFQPVKSQFDADTPIDKALSFLQSCIKVSRIFLLLLVRLVHGQIYWFDMLLVYGLYTLWTWHMRTHVWCSHWSCITSSHHVIYVSAAQGSNQSHAVRWRSCYVTFARQSLGFLALCPLTQNGCTWRHATQQLHCHLHS